MNTRLFVGAMLSASLLSTMAVAPPISAQSGQGVINGVVTDAATQQPISAVQVTIAGTTRGVQTGENGRYTIPNLPAGTYTLAFRRVGYGPVTRQNVAVASGATVTVDVSLTVSVLRLQSMVVTATSDPIEGAKSPLGVGRVTAEDIKSVPTLNSAAAAIQGKVAGVNIVRGSGQPGDGVSVQLRTPLNIRKSNSPMYVVDGVILGSTFDGTTVDLEALDIESIEVIKGASAASLYGSRAANGVISISTSRGAGLREGETRISTRSEFGQSYAPDNVDVSMHHHFRINEQGDFLTAAGVPTTDRTQRAIDGPGFVDNPYKRTFNNIGNFFNPGEFQAHSLTLSQNAATTNFLVSLNQKNEAGVLTGDKGFQQRNFRVNLDHRLGDEVVFRISAFHNRAAQANAQGAAFRTLLSYDPDVDLGRLDAQGRFLQAPDPTVLVENPLWSQQNENIGENRRARTLASLDGRYNPLSWLSLSSNLSYDRSDLNVDRYTAKGTPASVSDPDLLSTGRLEYRDENTDAINGSVSATALGSIGDLTARFTGSAIAEREKNLEFRIIGSNFVTVGIPDIDNAIDRSGESNLTEIRSNGYSGNLGLDYAGKYILDLVARRDGSSLFGPTSRWNTYGRAAAAYRLSEEPWWPFGETLNEFKIRYAIGTAGTRPSFSDQFEVWNTSTAGITRGGLGNRFLKPAQTTEQDLGLEMIFRNRYSLELAYVRARTVDQVSDVVLPAISGYPTQWRNTGTVTGNTYEMTMQAQWIARPNFTWSSTFIADRSTNRIEAWNTAAEPGDLTRDGEVGYTRTGASLADIYGQYHVRSLGDLPARFQPYADQFEVNDDGYVVPVGNSTWTDATMWGTNLTFGANAPIAFGTPIVAEEVNGTRRFVKLGNMHPDAQLGWLNNLNWKGLRMHSHVHAQVGGKVYNNTKQRMYQDFRHGDLDQSGKAEEQKKPYSYYFALYNANEVTNYFVEDGSYVKLRELAVSYTVRREQLARFGLDRAMPSEIALGVIGRNLYTITGYTGWDPEVGSPNNRVDIFSYPPPRNLTASVEIRF